MEPETMEEKICRTYRF